MPAKTKKKERVLPANLPHFGLHYNAMPRWFRFDSTVPGAINFHQEIWDGVGELADKKLETIKFRSGESEKLWTFPKVEICILAQAENMTVVHQVGKRKIEIPVPSTFSTEGHVVRTRTRLYVRIFLEDGSLNGHVGVLTGRGLGFSKRVGLILQNFQNNVVKPVQRKYPNDELSMSHFRMPLKAGTESTRITSAVKDESSLIYLPELNLNSDEPIDFLLSDEELFNNSEEFKDAQKWVLALEKLNASILEQYADEIGYQPIEKLVNAALPSLPLNGPPGDDFAEGTHDVLPSQDAIPASSYE